MELLAHRFVHGLGGHNVLGAGQLRGFAERGRAAVGAVLVDHVADSGAAASPVVVSDSPHFTLMYSSLEVALRALQLRRPLHKLLGFVLEACAMRAMSPLPSMEKSGHRLAGLRDAVDNTFCVQPGSMPITTAAATLGLRAGADHGAEEQLEVLAELQPAIGVGKAQRALDVVGDGLGRRRSKYRPPPG